MRQNARVASRNLHRDLGRWIGAVIAGAVNASAIG
jgi:hypothetical protein